jgi:phosphate transport system substrate-binding protein
MNMIDFTKSARSAVTLAATLALATVALPAAPAYAADVTLTETGSTLLFPLFKIWVDEYTKTHPGIHITTNATGSGAGIEQAISGTAQIGTSDAYMSDTQARQHPEIINVPMAISAQTVNYNLPGLNNASLKLDGPVLTDIYRGKIRAWDDKAIAALNPDVKLPHQDIIPVHRSEGSGDTFVFSQYLTFSTPSWENDIGYGTTIAWPTVAGGLNAEGNLGVLQLVQKTPYSIGYIGVSLHAEIAEAGLGTAALKSYSGEYLLPSPATIAAAAAALTPRTPPDQRLTLVNAPGANAYPLVNYEYAVVSTKQAKPEAAAALRKFLLWAIAPDESNERLLDEAHFIALPAHIWVLSHDQIETIK